MRKYMRINSQSYFFPVILVNEDDVSLRDLSEMEMIEEMCKPHLEEYQYVDVCADTIESADPMVHPFGCEEEQQMAIVSLQRCVNWPHVVVKKNTAREAQTIGSFNRIWEIATTMM